VSVQWSPFPSFFLPLSCREVVVPGKRERGAREDAPRCPPRWVRVPLFPSLFGMTCYSLSSEVRNLGPCEAYQVGNPPPFFPVSVARKSAAPSASGQHSFTPSIVRLDRLYPFILSSGLRPYLLFSASICRHFSAGCFLVLPSEGHPPLFSGQVKKPAEIALFFLGCHESYFLGIDEHRGLRVPDPGKPATRRFLLLAGYKMSLESVFSFRYRGILCVAPFYPALPSSMVLMPCSTLPFLG